MSGLLDDYNPTPLNQGLLGLAGALLTPRAMGGGIGAGMQAFNQGALSAQQMRNEQRRQAEMDAMRREQADMQRKQFGMQEQKFGLELDQYKAAQADAEAQKRNVAEVGQWIQQNRPELFPAFRLDPKGVTAQLLPQKPKTVTLKPGEQLFQEGNYDKPLASIPDKPPTPSELGKLTAEMNALPPGDPRRAVYADAIRKATTHAPAANQTVLTGSMVPVEGPNGPMYVMPGKDGSVVPLPGIKPPGSAKTELAEVNQRRSTSDMANRMIADVDSALGKIGATSTGTLGSMLSKVPATDAADLRATVTTLKANLGFNELQQIRAASPTGGALGATSENELLALQSTIANLDPNQSPEQLRKNLTKVKQHMTKIKSLIDQKGGPANSGGASGGWSVRKVP